MCVCILTVAGTGSVGQFYSRGVVGDCTSSYPLVYCTVMIVGSLGGAVVFLFYLVIYFLFDRDSAQLLSCTRVS